MEDYSAFITHYKKELNKCLDPVYFYLTYFKPNDTEGLSSWDQMILRKMSGHRVKIEGEIILTKIVNAVCTHYGTTQLELQANAKSSKRVHVYVRYMLFYLIKDAFKLPISHRRISHEVLNWPLSSCLITHGRQTMRNLIGVGDGRLTRDLKIILQMI